MTTLDANRSFYDALWSDARLVAPERFNTWPIARALAAQSPRRLEVAPGLRPRLPLAGTVFVDISAPALRRLRERGASTALGLVGALPLPDCAFDLVCALDIVEHVDDDDGALRELARVTAPGASLLVSVPLHASRWNAFDDFVGHRRRYEPDEFRAKQIKKSEPTIETSADDVVKTAREKLANEMTAIEKDWLSRIEGTRGLREIVATIDDVNQRGKLRVLEMLEAVSELVAREMQSHGETI